ncbi:MAG: hypothetical protein RL522_2337 [Pseudomonadota bacterium]|jgi:type IV pilus assembly protein PilE
MRIPPLAARGFTLIELMIVLAVIGVLSAIAYPVYQRQILRTHRVTAAACLQELAMQMERRYTLAMAYDNPATLPVAACTNALQGRYTFAFGPVSVPPATAGGSATTVNSPTASSYLLQATPQGAQSNDAECGTLGLDQQGARARSGTAADVQSCWR